MKPYRLYFIEVLWGWGWWRIGQTDDRKKAYEMKRRQEEEGDQVRIICKTY